MTRDKSWYISKAIALGVSEAKGERIVNPWDLYTLLQPYALEDQEQFIVVLLNGGHRVSDVKAITKGLVNRTVVHPREVFRFAIKGNATAIIIAHNHPSNQKEPSDEDIEITQRLCEAGKIVGIPVLDHLIICRDSYYSFQVAGTMPKSVDVPPGAKL